MPLQGTPALGEVERDEVAVLVVGDAIPDGAGIARRLEVLAEGLGQLLTAHRARSRTRR